MFILKDLFAVGQLSFLCLNTLWFYTRYLGEKMEIGSLFAVLPLDNSTENTSIMQINLVEKCDRLMLTILLSNFKEVSHFSLTFVST